MIFVVDLENAGNVNSSTGFVKPILVFPVLFLYCSFKLLLQKGAAKRRVS